MSEARRVALGTVRIGEDVRFAMPTSLDVRAVAGETILLDLECHYREPTRDRETVRVAVTSDLPGARASLFDFTDRPGVPDRLNVVLPHAFVARGSCEGVVRVVAECARQPWNGFDVLHWARGERTASVAVHVA